MFAFWSEVIAYTMLVIPSLIALIFYEKYTAERQLREKETVRVKSFFAQLSTELDKINVGEVPSSDSGNS